jgi:hypothetical protein
MRNTFISFYQKRMVLFFLEKYSIWVYDAEIATRQQINFNQNEVVSNKVVAERLMQNFKNSKAHYGSII